MARAALASSTFEVSIGPQAHAAEIGDARSGRMALKKIQRRSHPSSKGRMLTVRTDADGAAGDLAIGYVTGALHGMDQRFALRHRATMRGGAPALNVTVPTDSEPGQLAGFAGTRGSAIIDGTDHRLHNHRLQPSLRVRLHGARR